ncbi:MAG: SCP2 sterol-binding domain-containing protein [Gammaproteobacteria bacterium]|nr:SCP2 sterol-binding domain-containing protein [Gammaproteobacteria bacterium]
MIKLILARMLETTINQLIVLDPSHHDLLTKHAGKTLTLQLKDFNHSFYFRFLPNKINVYTVYEHVPDALIVGDVISLLKQIKPGNSAQDLIIEGDIDFAQDTQHFIQSIDINWEEYIAFLAGDFTTNQITKLWSKVKQSSTTNTLRTIEDVKDYIQEEKRFIPTREEVEDFYDEISKLRYDIERLEARWDRLEDIEKQ